MIALIQRVKQAEVIIEKEIFSKIENGILILLGISETDTEEDINWLANKVVNLRIFDDEEGVMNKSCIDESLDILTVSQFTLLAKTKKGNRPSYINAARPEISKPLYEKFVNKLDELMGKKTFTGKFAANMQINLSNDGPVTIHIDTNNKI